MKRCLPLLVLLAAGAAAALEPSMGFGGAPLAGAAFFDCGGLSDELSAMGLPTPRAGFDFGGTFRFTFGPGVQLGYFGQGGGFRVGDVFPDDVVKDCDVSYGMHHAVAGYKFYLLDGRVGVFAGGGAGLFGVTYVKTVSTSPYRYGNIPLPGPSTFTAELDGGAFSWQLFVAPEYRLLRWFALGVEVGYMAAAIPEGEMTQVGVPIPAAPGIDLSGPFFRAGPMFNF